MDEVQEEFDTNTPYINSPTPGRLRRLAGQIKEKYDSEEFQAGWQPVKITLATGNPTPIYVWVEERTSWHPDSELGAHLNPKALGSATPRETWELVDEYPKRLTPKGKIAANRRGADSWKRRARKFPGIKRVLGAAVEGRPRDHAGKPLLSAQDAILLVIEGALWEARGKWDGRE